ncbi:MAG: UV DNA damage repair endonuclease UvsE, partial [Candidatus Woesearchaeota archaeon]
MKIGYPCINKSIGCNASSTFKLASYSQGQVIQKTSNNLACLEQILQFNVAHGLLFFRISSDTIPFAGHPLFSFDWKTHFQYDLARIGRYIAKQKIRISMHPDQYVLLNALDQTIVDGSIAELAWHCQFLDALGLDGSAKVQIHVGGIYKDKEKAIERFITVFNGLPGFIKRRLAIENDERLFNLQDCLAISKIIGIPVIFDVFHHTCFHRNESLTAAMESASQTWKHEDGILMVDYSS